jgi:hypothetical protein
MSQAARFQEALRRLAIIDEAFVEGEVSLGLAGLGRVVASSPEVVTAPGDDIRAALEEPGGYWP